MHRDNTSREYLLSPSAPLDLTPCESRIERGRGAPAAAFARRHSSWSLTLDTSWDKSCYRRSVGVLRGCPKAFSFLPVFAILRTQFCTVCHPGARHRPKAS